MVKVWYLKQFYIGNRPIALILIALIAINIGMLAVQALTSKNRVVMPDLIRHP
jgi:hypothetical protein